MKENLTYDERKRALRYLIFLKEKHDGSIKARGCAIEDHNDNTCQKFKSVH